MPDVVAGHIESAGDVARVREAFARANPGFELRARTLDGEWELASDSVVYSWVERGAGRVWLEAGYRTQEGDGAPLPDDYERDRLAPDVAGALVSLHRLKDRAAAGARDGVEGLLARFDGRHGYAGDPMGELWRIRQGCGDIPRWWEAAFEGHPEAATALRTLIGYAPAMGWATKRSGGWEAVSMGDQIVTVPGYVARGTGRVRLWQIVDREAVQSHCSAVRRLRYLRDTAGGCAPGFDAFRRLPLTWFTEPDGSLGDGRNRLNSHVVNIAAEQSRTHYHPADAVGGGKAQCELYVVLDPSELHLSTAGRAAHLDSFPDVGDWARYERTPLRPGDVVVIPPGTGHRGVDAFVNVVTLPGFKPRNELYVDDAIAASGRGAPYNDAFAEHADPGVKAS